jgi:HAD superfamily hydrolase (TIGR01509 family)
MRILSIELLLLKNLHLGPITMPDKISIPPEIKGLIFDCDGTLVDSMPMHMQAWQQAFERQGVRYDHDFLYSLKGMKETDVILTYNAHYNANLDPEEMVQDKHSILVEQIHMVKPIDIIVEIARSHYGSIPLAVVSGSPKKIVHPELEAIGIINLFETILTADDPFRPKPAPDIFLEAAARIGIEPSYCQVFEDGDPGLEAARHAGMLATDIRHYI